MSGAIATAYVKLIPTFDKQLKSSIVKELGGVDSSSAGAKVGRLFSSGVGKGMGGLQSAMTSRFSAATVALGNIAARAVTSAMSAVGSSLDSAIARVDTMNNFPRIMEGMGISAEASSAAIKRMSEGIDGLPTALDDAVSGVARFTSKNGDIDKSTDYFLAVNNAIAAGGQSMQVQSSALEQLSQSYSKGRMDMMEWRSLQQAMPAQINQIAKAMNMTADELGEGLRNGTVSMDEFMDKIVELNKEGVDGLDSFEQQARKATGGIGTALTNVQNRINKAVAGILDAIGQQNISDAINAFSSQFGKIGSIIGGLDADGNVLGFIGGLRRGLDSALEGWEPAFSVDWDAMFAGAQEAASKLGEWLSGPLATLAKSTDSALARIGAAWDDAMSRLNLPEIDWDAVSQGVSGVIEALAGFHADVIVNAINTAVDLGNKLGEVFGPFIENVAPGLESLGRSAQEFFAPIADFLTGNGPLFEGTMAAIQGILDSMSPILADMGGHFSHICESLEPLAGPVGEMATEVLGGLLTVVATIGPVVATILDAIAGAIDRLVSGLTYLGGMLEDVGLDFGAVWNGFSGNLLGPINRVDVLKHGIESLPTSRSSVISVSTGNASGVLDNLLAKLRAIAGNWTVSVTASVFGSIGRAAGGLAMLHASGGFITDGPTWLGRDASGIGHVAGEAGREWVMRHADGTTSILPIENGRYLGPYADMLTPMIASRLGGGSTNNYYITLSYDASADANDLARGLTRELRLRNLMGA